MAFADHRRKSFANGNTVVVMLTSDTNNEQVPSIDHLLDSIEPCSLHLLNIDLSQFDYKNQSIDRVDRFSVVLVSRNDQLVNTKEYQNQNMLSIFCFYKFPVDRSSRKFEQNEFQHSTNFHTNNRP